MKLVRRIVDTAPRDLGILSGTFHPVTRAHLALAEAALERCDEVLFVLPKMLPHKEYDSVPLETRLEILRTALEDEDRFSAAVSDGGLFAEIAAEARSLFPNVQEIRFVCGADAAERIVTWDYGRPGAIEEMMREFSLLVADRQGHYEPPASLASRIEPLIVGEEWNPVSATEVRSRIERGEPWMDLVPERAVELVRRFYC